MAKTTKTSDFSKYPRRLIKRLRTAVKKTGTLVATYIRREYFGTDTGPTTLRVRSGKLRRGIRGKDATIKGWKVRGGVTAGSVYSVIHFGRKGKRTTIKPRKAKMLAIPLKAAMTPAGVARGTPRGGPWGKTFIAKSKAGNLIIFGRRKIMKGARAGVLKGKVVPLFVLKTKVKVPTRIHPKAFMPWAKREMIRATREAATNV